MKKRIALCVFALVYVLLCIAIPVLSCSVGIIVMFLLTNFVYQKAAYKKFMPDTSDFLPQPLFRNNYDRNFECISLGNGVDYLKFPPKVGLNLSVGKQSLSVDWKILSFYHSYLKKGAYVIFPLSPFQNKDAKNDFMFYANFLRRLPRSTEKMYGDYYSRWVYLLPSEQIPTLRKSMLYVRFPLLFCLKKRTTQLVVRDSLSADDATLLQKSLEFCKERGYHPVILLPPVSAFYANGETGEKMQQFCASIKNMFCQKALVLDYTFAETWADDVLWEKHTVLKTHAKEKFTEEILNAIRSSKNSNTNDGGGYLFRLSSHWNGNMAAKRQRNGSLYGRGIFRRVQAV